jgi:hypothetical protein
LNNQGDVLIRISKKFFESKDELETIYFFQASFKVNKILNKEIDPEFISDCRKDRRSFLKEDDFSKLKGQNILILPARKEFTMNKESLFIYDNNSIEIYDFNKSFSEKNKRNLRFQIAKDEKQSHIEQVITSDSSEDIAIVIE